MLTTLCLICDQSTKLLCNYCEPVEILFRDSYLSHGSILVASKNPVYYVGNFVSEGCVLFGGKRELRQKEYWIFSKASQLKLSTLKP